MAEYERLQKIVDAQEDSVFLWGARQVEKSTLVKALYPKAKVYDLLMSDEYGRLDRHPRLLNGIEVLQATEFLRRMWQGDLFYKKQSFL